MIVAKPKKFSGVCWFKRHGMGMEREDGLKAWRKNFE